MALAKVTVLQTTEQVPHPERLFSTNWTAGFKRGKWEGRKEHKAGQFGRWGIDVEGNGG